MPEEFLRTLLANEWLITLATAASAVCAAFLAVRFVVSIYRSQKTNAGEIIITDASPGIFRSFLPTARALGVSLRSTMNGHNKNSAYFRFADNIERRLTAAGHPEGLIADEFVGFGVLYGVLWATLAMVGYALLYPDDIFTLDGFYLALIAFGFGCLLWKSWLSNKLNLRQNSIRRQLPFALDLLTLSMEAGLDFTSALARILTKMGKSPLGQELSLMLHEIQLGKSRADAMRDFAARCDVQEVRTVIASLVQAEELGSSIGTVLRIQAGQQRERRSQRAEEKAMKAPVKMLFPMVFILMALMTLIGAPILLSYILEG